MIDLQQIVSLNSALMFSCKGPDLSMFYLKRWVLLQEVCDQRRGSHRGGAVLFWSKFLRLLETGALSPSPHLTPWRRAGYEMCEKSNLHKASTRLTIKGNRSPPFTLFFSLFSLVLFFSLAFFSFSVLAPQLWWYPHGVASAGAKYWSYSLFSSLALPGWSAATIFCPLLSSVLYCRSGDIVAGCCGLLPSTLEYWCAVPREPAAFEEFIVGVENLMKCT